MEKQIQELRKMLEVQGQSGNWNYDPYMHGMYNGIEFALALMENRDPSFREAPKMWVADIPMGKFLGDPESAVQ